jgi:hypothetical protein
VKLFISLAFIIFSATCFAQTNNYACWRSSQRGSITLTVGHFDTLINIFSKRLAEHDSITNFDYVVIVKLSNTLFVNRENAKDCWPEKNTAYKKFSELCNGKYFFDQLTKHLGTCIPNKGMGCYFERFKLHWGGSVPDEKSIFQVK